MTMKRTLAPAALGACLGLALAAAPAAAECGRVSISNMNWASAEFAAHVDRIVLESAFGCEVELVPGDTVPTLTSMTEKGEPDIAPEMWVNTAGEPLAAALAEGRLVRASEILSDGGREGWWVPRYFKEAHPEIETIDDALARPDLFPHPEYSDLGAVYGCPSGWACQYVNDNLFRAWGGEDKGFELVDPGSAAGLAGAIARAYERGEPWLGYYWSPTAILGKYDMAMLGFGVPHDSEHWKSCTAIPDCQDPKPNAWVESLIYTVVTSRFAESAPEALDYLRKRSWPAAVASAILSYMDENQYKGEDGAIYFFENHEDLWTPWLTAEQAERVRAAL